MRTKEDLTEEKYVFEERLAIVLDCPSMTEKDAMAVASEQLKRMIEAHAEKNRGKEK